LTWSGSATGGNADGQGTNAKYAAPAGLAIRGSVLYVTDYTNNNVRIINASGYVSTLAGCMGPSSPCSPASGFVDNVVGTNAQFNGIRGVAVDLAGQNLYLGDYSNNRVRLLNLATLNVTTFTGSTAGEVDGFGTSALHNVPYMLATDPVSGNLFVADNSGARIRRITPRGLVTTLAGSAAGSAIDGLGSAARFSSPFGAAVDQSGNFYTSEFTNYRIRKLSPPSSFSNSFALPVCDSTTWRHVALTLSTAGVAALYVDGALMSSSAVTVNTAAWASASLSIAGNAFEEGFSGALGDVRVYNRTLAAAEVLALARPPLPPVANTVLSPDPAVAPASTTSFTYACAPGYVGAPVVVSRNADGTWARSGGLGGQVSCTTCSALQFTQPGGIYCIDVPSLPSLSLAVFTPPVAAVGIFSYNVTCAPGSAGLSRTFSYAVANNNFALSGAFSCTPCNAATEFSLSPAASGAPGSQCRACSSVDPNLVVASALTNYSGSEPPRIAEKRARALRASAPRKPSYARLTARNVPPIPLQAFRAAVVLTSSATLPW
jgi:hypothetical protein